MTNQRTKNPLPPKTAWRYHRLVGSLLLLLVFSVIAGYWLLFSSSGLQSVVTAVNRWGDGTIQLTGVHGTLHNLHIEDIRFNNDELALALQNLHMNWNPTQLLHRRVSINRLVLESIRINQHVIETAPNSRNYRTVCCCRLGYRLQSWLSMQFISTRQSRKMLRQ